MVKHRKIFWCTFFNQNNDQLRQSYCLSKNILSCSAQILTHTPYSGAFLQNWLTVSVGFESGMFPILRGHATQLNQTPQLIDLVLGIQL